MSELDAVKQGVERVGAEVASAKQASEQALTVAGDKSNEFAMLGLEGVAQVLQTVADQMSAVVSGLGVAHGFCDEAVSALTPVTDKTKVSETVAALGVAGQKLTLVGQELSGASAQGNDALTHAQESEAEVVVNAVFAAVSAIDQANGATQTASGLVSDYAGKIGQAGQGLLTASGGGGGSAVASQARPRASTSPGLVATPLDAVPPKDREPIAKIGDPAEPPKLGPPESQGPFKKELDSTDDGDTSKSKAQSFGRGMIRNMSDVEGQSKTTAKAAYAQLDGIDPPDESETYATVGVAEPLQPVYGSAPNHGSPEATVGTVVVVAAVAVEGFTRFVKSVGGKKNG